MRRRRSCWGTWRDIAATKERIQSLLDQFEEISKDTTNIMKENSAKVKKMREQSKKDVKSLDKKRAVKKKK